MSTEPTWDEQDLEPHFSTPFMNKTATISQLLATPDGSYINAEVRGFLSQIKPSNGRGPSKASLRDQTGVIEVSLWGGDVTHWEGKHIKLSGKGMQRKDYRGTLSLSVGEKVNIEAGEESPDSPISANPRPVSPREAAFHGSPTPKPVAPKETALPVNLPHGATVGGALARAVDIAIATGALPTGGWGENEITIIERITRDLVEIQGRIERGESPGNQPF